MEARRGGKGRKQSGSKAEARRKQGGDKAETRAFLKERHHTWMKACVLKSLRVSRIASERIVMPDMKKMATTAPYLTEIWGLRGPPSDPSQG